MEGDTTGGGDQKNISDGPCFASEEVKVKARKHVAVLESSESEDEAFELQPQSGDSKIKKSHSTFVPDSDDSEGNVTPTASKFVHQLDWDAWRKRKEEETRQKKILQQQKAEQKAKLINDQCEYAKHMAWVNWVCKKKNDELQKKVNEIESQRIHEKFKTEKEKIAKEKFEQWFKKKQQHELLKKQCKNAEEEMMKGAKKNLTRNMKWEAWYEKKKAQTIPKSFSHVDYPKPSWVNPEPWHRSVSGEDSE